MSANQVWQSLLEDLKESPLEIPESWLRDTGAHWDSEELNLVVTVPYDTNEVWLDRRFLPLAKIYFREEHDLMRLVANLSHRTSKFHVQTIAIHPAKCITR